MHCIFLSIHQHNLSCNKYRYLNEFNSCYNDTYYNLGYVKGYADGLNSNYTILYTHHVHSTSSASETVVNSSWETSSVSSTYTDSYKASSSGGCYTQAVYTWTYRTCGANNWTYLYDNFTDSNGYINKTFRCNSCGNTTSCTTTTTPGSCTASIKDKQVLSGYTRTCGYSLGQVLAAKVYFDETTYNSDIGE